MANIRKTGEEWEVPEPEPVFIPEKTEPETDPVREPLHEPVPAVPVPEKVG